MMYIIEKDILSEAMLKEADRIISDSMKDKDYEYDCYVVEDEAPDESWFDPSWFDNKL